jgi:hypothetical protein
MQVDKICFTNFVDLTRLAHLRIQPLAFSMKNIHRESNSWIFKKFFNKNIYTRLVAIIIK